MTIESLVNSLVVKKNSFNSNETSLEIADKEIMNKLLNIKGIIKPIDDNTIVKYKYNDMSSMNKKWPDSISLMFFNNFLTKVFNIDKTNNGIFILKIKKDSEIFSSLYDDKHTLYIILSTRNLKIKDKNILPEIINQESLIVEPIETFYTCSYMTTCEIPFEGKTHLAECPFSFGYIRTLNQK